MKHLKTFSFMHFEKLSLSKSERCNARCQNLLKIIRYQAFKSHFSSSSSTNQVNKLILKLNNYMNNELIL